MPLINNKVLIDDIQCSMLLLIWKLINAWTKPKAFPLAGWKLKRGIWKPKCYRIDISEYTHNVNKYRHTISAPGTSCTYFNFVVASNQMPFHAIIFNWTLINFIDGFFIVTSCTHFHISNTKWKSWFPTITYNCNWWMHDNKWNNTKTIWTFILGNQRHRRKFISQMIAMQE